MNNMDRLEVRVPDEIKDYKEKYGGFTVRQWIGIVLAIVVCIPTYLILYHRTIQILAAMGTMLVAAPVALIFFIPINGMPAEKMIPYFRRSLFCFNQVLSFQTEHEREVEQELLKDKKYRKSMKKLKKLERKEQLKIERGKASEENAKVKELRASVDQYYQQLRKEKIRELSSSFKNLSKKEKKKLRKEKRSHTFTETDSALEKEREEAQRLEEEIEAEKEQYTFMDETEQQENKAESLEEPSEAFSTSAEMEDSPVFEKEPPNLPKADSEVAETEMFIRESDIPMPSVENMDLSFSGQESNEQQALSSVTKSSKAKSKTNFRSQATESKPKRSSQKDRKNPNRPHSKSQKGNRQSGQHQKQKSAKQPKSKSRKP